MCLALETETQDKEKKLMQARGQCINSVAQLSGSCNAPTLWGLLNKFNIDGDTRYIEGKTCTQIFDYYVALISNGALNPSPDFCESLMKDAALSCEKFFCPILDNTPSVTISPAEYIDCGNKWASVGEFCDVSALLREHLVPKCGDAVLAPTYGEECEPGITAPLSCDQYFTQYPDAVVPGDMVCAGCKWSKKNCKNPACGNGVFDGGDNNPYPEFTPEICDSTESINCGFFPGYYRDLDGTEKVPCAADCSGWNHPSGYCTLRPKKKVQFVFTDNDIIFRADIVGVGTATSAVSSKTKIFLAEKWRHYGYLASLRGWTSGVFFGPNWIKLYEA